MKKLVLLPILLLFILAGCTKKDDGLKQIDAYQTVYQGNLYVTGATDLTAFKNITNLEGSLTISDEISMGHPAVTTKSVVKDISALKNLKIITGGLTIGQLSELKSLAALANVERIDEGISIAVAATPPTDWGMPKLTTLNHLQFVGLNGVLSFKNLGTNLQIKSLSIATSAIDSITNLSSLGQIGTLSINGNSNLKSIGDMSNLSILNGFYVIGSDKLTRIGKIKNISAHASVVLHTLNIENLDCLSNVSYLGDLSIQFCKNMRSLNLSNFKNINYFSLTDSRYIKTLDGFQNCRKMSVVLVNNASLENLDGLQNMTNASTVHIANNFSLKSIAALSNLGDANTIVSVLNVSDNINLQDLCPVSKVVKNALKARQTNPMITLPVVKNNGIGMSLEDMVAKCP